MADRTWTVRVNLDDLGAEMLALDDDAERGAWLTGFQVGAAGAPCRDSWSEARKRGWAFGQAAYIEAEEFRAKKAAAGEASASARRARTGSAQPSRLERRSNTVRTPFEQRSKPVREFPEHAPNQPTANSQQLTTNNEQHPPTPQGGRKRVEFDSGMFDGMIPQDLARSPEFVEEWHRWVQVRKDRRKPITPHAAGEQLKFLAGQGPQEGIASIRQSIANDWQGLFALKGPGGRPPQSKGPPPVRASADQRWIEQNAGRLKTITANDGEHNEPAW